MDEELNKMYTQAILNFTSKREVIIALEMLSEISMSHPPEYDFKILKEIEITSIQGDVKVTISTVYKDDSVIWMHATQVKKYLDDNDIQYSPYDNDFQPIFFKTGALEPYKPKF